MELPSETRAYDEGYVAGLTRAKSFLRPVLGELRVRRSLGTPVTTTTAIDLFGQCISSEINPAVTKPVLRRGDLIRCRFCQQRIGLVLSGSFHVFKASAPDENPYMCDRCADSLRKEGK